MYHNFLMLGNICNWLFLITHQVPMFNYYYQLLFNYLWRIGQNSKVKFFQLCKSVLQIDISHQIVLWTNFFHQIPHFSDGGQHNPTNKKGVALLSYEFGELVIEVVKNVSRVKLSNLRNEQIIRLTSFKPQTTWTICDRTPQFTVRAQLAIGWI